MSLSTYKNDQDVKKFIEWIEPKLSTEDSFNHLY